MNNVDHTTNEMELIDLYQLKNMHCCLFTVGVFSSRNKGVLILSDTENTFTQNSYLSVAHTDIVQKCLCHLEHSRLICNIVNSLNIYSTVQYT